MNRAGRPAVWAQLVLTVALSSCATAGTPSGSAPAPATTASPTVSSQPTGTESIQPYRPSAQIRRRVPARTTAPIQWSERSWRASRCARSPASIRSDSARCRWDRDPSLWARHGRSTDTAGSRSQDPGSRPPAAARPPRADELTCPAWLGWAATGDPASGTKWFVDDPSACPDPGADARAFMMLGDYEAIHCYRGLQLTFVGWLRPAPSTTEPTDCPTSGFGLGSAVVGVPRAELGDRLREHARGGLH